MHCNSNSLQLQSEEELDLQDWLHYQETPNTPPLPTITGVRCSAFCVKLDAARLVSAESVLPPVDFCTHRAALLL